MPENITDGSVMLLKRQIGQIPYYPNQERKFDLKLQPNLIKKLMLHVHGLGQTAAGETADVNGRTGIFPFIRNIQIRASNGVILKSIDPAAMNYLNTYEHGANELTIAPAAGFADTGGRGWSFDLSIPFESLTSFISERTLLNTNEFSEIGIYIQWGDPSDFPLSSGTNTSLILSEVVCDIVALERVPVDMTDELLNRQRMVDTMQFRNVSSNNETITFDLPENTLIKTLVFYLEHTKLYVPEIPLVPGATKIRLPLHNGVLRARVEDNNGAHVIREMSGRQIQSDNNAYYRMSDLTPREWQDTGGDSTEVSDLYGNQKPGVYALEFDEMHDFSSLYSTIGINYPKLILDLGVLPGAVAFYEQSYRVILLQRQIITPASVTR